ncbi:MAG: PAS domain-containing protein [Cytophagaceae bacterium]|nr:PAS domain-containing protein [Cytophagaceae bacterium]
MNKGLEGVDNPELNKKLEVGKKTSRNLTRLYIAALTAVALLTITGQILIRDSINNQLSDSHVINLAGSQRYKSQQICKMTLLIYSDIDHKDFSDKGAVLKQLLEQWKRGHEGLQFGNEELSLPGNNSKQIRKMFKELDPYFNTIYNNAQRIVIVKENKLNISKENLAVSMRLILDNENNFLQRMDAIVHQYDNEAREKVVVLKSIETVLLIITLIILLVEGIFIFRPAAVKIRNTIHDLVLSEAKASSLAKDLSEANNSLEKSIKELKDINFALEHATILAKTDKYGVINYVNDKFCEISKYSREELIGNRFHILSGHYHSRLFFDNMWETISVGKIWNNEIKNRAKDGSYFWLDATVVPVLDKENIPVEYIAIYTDVTERFRQSINEQKIRSSSIIEGQEKERRKIARELHDGLGQMLTALKFTIEGLKGAHDHKEKELLSEIKKLIYETIAEVRKISFNLMPTVLNDFGIVPAFKHLSDQVSKSSKTNVIFENSSVIERLPKTVEINLYRIMQEALNNAIKYSEADEVRVKLMNSNEYLQLEISDNGKGFTATNINNKKRVNQSGNGIINIQERTSLIDGQFRIETAPGMGTKIFIKVPISLE